MTPKAPLVFAVFLASTAALPAAYAQIYQWKDANGQTVVSDTPPPASAKNRRALGTAQPSVVKEKLATDKAEDGVKAAAEPKTTAEKDLEFKKRQQEAKEKAEKHAKEQAAEAEKRENCERARRNLAALEANQPMAVMDEQGQRKMMDNSEREQEIERARRFMAETCK